MCGIEVLLCCAAAGAGGGCYAKKKMDKKAGKKAVKGEGETYQKSKENKMPKTKEKQAAQPHHRLSAYEEYAAKYPQKVPSQPAEIHHRATRAASPSGGSPKGGVMDADEFERLKRAQQKDKLKLLQ